MSNEFRQYVLAMSAARPNARVSTIVALALACETTKPSSLDDAERLMRWALLQPEVAAMVSADKKINAIKELRTLTGASLLQAKNAVDLVPAGRWGR